MIALCKCCGQLKGIPEYDAKLKDLHERRKDERQNIEPLVYTLSDLEDDPDWWYDRKNSGPWLAMERNMAQRGLCVECGRPDLSGLKPEDFYSKEEFAILCDMWAEQAAERRAGC